MDFPKEGYHYFKFKKVDGSIRFACGTLDSEVIAQYHTFSSTGKPSNPEVQVYFDLDALAFRSFKKSNFIGFITEEEYDLVDK